MSESAHVVLSRAASRRRAGAAPAAGEPSGVCSYVIRTLKSRLPGCGKATRSNALTVQVRG